MIYFSIKFVRGACRARLCVRNYGSIAVSDVGIADTKSIRDIGSLRKGGESVAAAASECSYLVEAGG